MCIIFQLGPLSMCLNTKNNDVCRCFLVGVPGIEPGLHPPHGRVLPVYYTPIAYYFVAVIS
jgi:hypothetical protein